MKRMPFSNGDEEDALTKARKFYHWRPSQIKKIKRSYHKKERKWLKRLLLKDYEK